MKRMWIALVAAAFVMVLQAAPASADKDKGETAEGQTARSTGSHPVVYDDYPESEVVISVTDDIVLTVTGEARTRFEWVENNTDFSDDGVDSLADDNSYDDEYYFAPARFDIGFRVDLPRDVAAVIQLQSGFDFGGNGSWATDDRAHVNQALRPGALNTLNGPGAANKIGGPGDSDGSTDLDDARLFRTDQTDGVRVYQGYIETAKIGGSIFSMRFGRQELAYGTEFLLGNQDWYDGLSYDGIKGIFQFTDCARMDLFWAKLAENNLDGTTLAGSGNDIDMYGAYASINNLGGSSVGMDAYIIGESDHRDLVWDLDVDQTLAGNLVLGSTPGVSGTSDGESFKDVWWAGVRFFREREHGLHFSGEVTYQFGNVNADFNDSSNPIVDDDNVDIDAWAFEGFMGWTFPGATHPDLHWGFTWASGSDIGNYDNGKSATFFTPAGEIHPRLGLMDLVEASNIQAYNIGYAGMQGNHSWGVDVFHFEMDNVPPEVDLAVLGNGLLDARDEEGLDTDLGNELDLYYNYQYTKNLVAQFAVGYFDPGGYIDDYNECANGGCNVNLVGLPANIISTDGAWRAYANLLLRF